MGADKPTRWAIRNYHIEGAPVFSQGNKLIFVIGENKIYLTLKYIFKTTVG